MDFTVNYLLVNLGNGVATQIEVADRYDPNSFELIGNFDQEGVVTMTFDELAPGSQTTFNVTVRPKLYGMYESTRARYKYHGTVAMDNIEPEVKQGLSTSLGRTKIISTVEYARDDYFFFKQWAIFGVIYAIPTLLPLYLWNQSRISRSTSGLFSSSNTKKQK